MEFAAVAWAVVSFAYVGTMSGFAFVLGMCNHRIARKTIFKSTLILIVVLYVLSFILLRLIYHWHFLIEAVLLLIIMLAWVGGRKCQIAGLTGGIACGKSTAAELMRHQGLSVIDSDEVAHRVIDRMACKIGAAFPYDGVLTQDGTAVDFPRLSQVVFSNKAKLRKLNAMTHWKIGWELVKEVFYRKFINHEKYVVIDMPLLFETKVFAYICFPIVLVYLDNKEVQIRRLMDRKNGTLTREEVITRIDAQMSMEYKKKQSDLLLNNEGTVEELEHDILGKLFPLLVTSIE